MTFVNTQWEWDTKNWVNYKNAKLYLCQIIWRMKTYP